MVMNLKNELHAVNKELKALSKKIDKLIQKTGKIDKTKPTKKALPSKKSVSKPDKTSAIDEVMGIIKRSRKVVDIAVLKDKTGFEGQKLHNIVYILKKQGKIKSAGKGFYEKA